MTTPHLAETPPIDDHVTPYDLDHGKIYLRLLDADAASADWREVAQIVLGLDPDDDPAHAQRVYDSHLARARWMTTTGYRDLLLGNVPRSH